jgi:uncharacterized protein (TIGR03083 family)
LAATPDAWIDVQEERQALLSLLETLTPSQWDSPSLCSEWRVRDVVGHMVSETTLTIPKVVAGALMSGFRINRFIAIDARRRGSVDTAVLLEDFRTAVPTRTHLRGLTSLSMLVDIVIHSLDIRRPLNAARTVPESRAVLVAADLRSSRFFPGRRLFAGLRVEATDADWSAGEGPVVRGPIEELILAMSGRPGGLDQLQGEGSAAVCDRAGGQKSQNQKNQNVRRGVDHV